MRCALASTAAAGAVLAIAAAGTLPARAQVAGFSDVPKTHWAADSIGKLANTGIIQGNSDKPLGTPKKVAQASKAPAKPAYNGEKPVTRYEAAVLLWRMVQYLDQTDKMKKGALHASNAPVDGPAAIKSLVAAGYLPKNTPLLKNGDKAITSNEFADALAAVVTKNREKATPLTPGSLKTLPIEKPGDSGDHPASHGAAPNS